MFKMKRKNERRVVLCLTVAAVVHLTMILYVHTGMGDDVDDTRVGARNTEEECPVDQVLGLDASTALSGIDIQTKQALECRFRLRRIRFQQACEKHQLPLMPTTTMVYFKQRRAFMCILNKIGSMFWWRYIRNYGDDVKNELQKVPAVFHHTVSFVFVRNPYTRLLSGYVDKLFSANPGYWGMYGKYVMLSNRPSVDTNVTCGYDVTFSEFVNSIIKEYQMDSNSMDPHFAPIQNMCHFCHRNYDVIGKMETFMDDMLYISDAIGSLDFNATRQFISNSNNAVEEEIHLNLYNVFKGRRQMIENCGVSLIQALKMNWRRWQIRGFIETKFQFPLEDSEDNITWQMFEQHALKARALSDKRQLALAKREALIEAFSTITLENKLKLKAMFLPQFDMFGYDPMPDFVFGEYHKPPGEFSFFEKTSILSNV